MIHVPGVKLEGCVNYGLNPLREFVCSYLIFKMLREV